MHRHTLSFFLAWVTAAATATGCQDLMATGLNGHTEPWKSDRLSIVGRVGFLQPWTCQSLSGNSEQEQILHQTMGSVLQNFMIARMEVGNTGESLGVVFLSVFTKIFDLLNNQCIESEMTNHNQQLYLDFFNSTGAPVYTAAQACCACGGGSTRSDPPNPLTHLRLKEFYNATGGQHWYVNGGWKSGDTHFCLWPYVRCDGQSEIFSLAPFFNNLTGTIPSSISDLSSLRIFVLGPTQDVLEILSKGFVAGSHDMSGTIPASIESLSSLSAIILFSAAELKSLDATTSRASTQTHGISGTIAKVSGSLRVLCSMFVSVSGTVPSGFNNAIAWVQAVAHADKTFSGTLPASWGSSGILSNVGMITSLMSGSLPQLRADDDNCTCLLLSWSPYISGTLPPAPMQLKFASFPASGISGTISPSWFASTMLETLLLSGTQTSGTLPFSGHSPIYRLRAVRSRISGIIPCQIGDLSKLKQLGLGHSALSGTLPSEVENLSLLRHFFTPSLLLSGSIPAFDPELQALILGDNKLSGSLQASFNVSSKIQYLDLSSNQLVGDLAPYRPPKDARTVIIHTNKLSGTLPPWDKQLWGHAQSNLIAVLVAGNKFSGTFPGEILAKSQSLAYFSNSACDFSGTLPAELCPLTTLLAFATTNNRLSGYLPPCFGSLSAMETLSFARNYISGSIPEQWNGLVSLQTLFGFSNVLRCNAPDLGLSHKLGTGEFSGINYPAQTMINTELRDKGIISNGDFTMQQKMLRASVPTVKNSVLLYTGNAWLTTSAALIWEHTVPLSLQKDNIRKGSYGLLEGQADVKEQYWVLLPSLLLLSVVSVSMSLRISNHLSWAGLRQAMSNSVSCSWQTERNSARRFLRRGIGFSKWCAIFSLALIVFYVSEALEFEPQYRCKLWTMDISILSLDMFPWDQPTSSKSSQWCFVTVGILFFFVCDRYWGPLSSFACDPHCKKARRIYRGLLLIDHLQAEMLEKGVDLRVKMWSRRALGDYEIRKRRSFKHIVCVILCWLLHLPPTLFLSMPTLMFIMSQNISAENILISSCGNPVVVVILNQMIRYLFLRRITFWLVTIRQWGQPKDEIGFNRHRVESLYMLLFFSVLIVPMVGSFLLDENCQRRYLLFSTELRDLMKYWLIDQQGMSAFRAGFCLNKLVTIYTPIWLLNAAIPIFMGSSWMMVKMTSPYKKCATALDHCCMNVWGKCGLLDTLSPQDKQLDEALQEAESLIATILVNLTAGISFALWSPVVLLLTALLCPMLNLTLEICTMMECPRQVPVPNKMLGLLSLGTLWGSMALALLDFGFGAWCWIVFIALSFVFVTIQFCIWFFDLQARTQAYYETRDDRVSDKDDEDGKASIHFHRVPERLDFSDINQPPPVSSLPIGINSRVEVRWRAGDIFYPAMVVKDHGNGMYCVKYDDGEREDQLQEDCIRHAWIPSLERTPATAGSIGKQAMLDSANTSKYVKNNINDVKDNINIVEHNIDVALDVQTAAKQVTSHQDCGMRTKKVPAARGWCAKQDEQLLAVMAVHPKEMYKTARDRWSAISAQMENRTGMECAARSRILLSRNTLAGDWTPEQDNMLLAAIDLHPQNVDTKARWGAIAKSIAGKSSKQCAARAKILQSQVPATPATMISPPSPGVPTMQATEPSLMNLYLTGEI